MDTERKRHTLKLWVRISLAVTISIGILFPLLEIYLTIVTVKVQKKNKIYTSTIDQNVNYKVSLFDNTFVNTTEMEEDQIYISDLVKNINFNFMYTYSATDTANLNYKYSINGKLYGENTTADGANEIVWQKDYVLLEEKNNNNDSSGFNISENLNLDYQKYKDEVNNFRKQFGMSLNTKLKITMNIDITGKYKNNNINKNNNIVLDIPVGVQAFSITRDYKKKDTKNIYEKENQLKIKDPVYTNLCITVAIISIILFILSFKAIFNIKPKSKYTKELNRILKTYGQIIVEVKTPPKEKKLNTIIVKNFDEMIDLEEELRIPIIMYENPYNYTTTFTLTYNNTIYKYTLKNLKK